MPEVSSRLPGQPVQGGFFRLDTAATLKRFFHLERALTIACGGWIPGVARLETKALLARIAWENAMTAEAERLRAFELKYPDRSLDVGEDAEVVRVYEALLPAPSGVAVLSALADVLLPAITREYERYLEASDLVADGPTHRFLGLSVREKHAQIAALREARDIEATVDPAGASAAGPWLAALEAALADGEAGRPVTLPETHPFEVAQSPVRDERYLRNAFYWPDNFDASFPYGHGMQLQLRSAVSHLNEVWAVETAGAILQGLSGELGWEFVVDASRWLYDESRHMTMGQVRLQRWGFQPGELPLGTFIYDASRGQDPIHRLGMLAYFETKNIGKKRDRAEEFHTIGDESSARDMDFDWADEGIHASYGRRWMKALLESRGRNADEWSQVLGRCEELVEESIAAAPDQQRAELREHVARLIERGHELAL